LVHGAGDRRDACPPQLHGEIFVCLDEAVSQARRFHTTWQSELVRYVVHGVLHLLGYDDAASRARRRMKEAEDNLVGQLASQFDVRSLCATQAQNRV
jgi:rRNA maturation RNase YbeY